MGKGLTTAGLIVGLTLGGATEAKAEQVDVKGLQENNAIFLAQADVKDLTGLALELEKAHLVASIEEGSKYIQEVIIPNGQQSIKVVIDVRIPLRESMRKLAKDKLLEIAKVLKIEDLDDYDIFNNKVDYEIVIGEVGEIVNKLFHEQADEEIKRNLDYVIEGMQRLGTH